eukprot:gene19698-26389_t
MEGGDASRYQKKTTLVDTLRSVCVAFGKFVVGVLKVCHKSLLGSVKVLLALVFLLVLALIIYIIVKLLHMFTSRYQRSNKDNVADYNHTYKSNLIQSMSEVYLDFKAVENVKSIAQRDAELMDNVRTYVTCVDTAIDGLRSALASEDVRKYVVMLMKNLSETGFDVPQVAKQMDADSIMTVIIGGEVINPNSRIFHFISEALDQEYLESISKKFRTDSGKCTDDVWNTLYQTYPDSGAYSSPVDALEKRDANNLSIFGKILGAYAALSSIPEREDNMDFIQYASISFFRTGRHNTELAKVLDYESREDYKAVLDKVVDHFLIVINLLLAGGAVMKFRNIKAAASTGEMPPIIQLSDEEKTKIGGYVRGNKFADVLAIINAYDIKLDDKELYKIKFVASTYNSFDLVKEKLLMCEELYKEIKTEKANDHHVKKAIMGLARLKVNACIATCFTTDYDFPATLRVYKLQWSHVAKYYIDLLINCIVSWGKNVFKLWKNFGLKVAESFKHFPELAKKWANKYKPTIKGGPLLGIYRLSPLYSGEGFINKIGQFFKAIPKGIGKAFKPITDVFKALGKFFVKTLPGFLKNLHNWIIGLLVLLIWCILFVILMLLSPILLLIGTFIVPFILTIWTSMITLVVYQIGAFFILIGFVLDMLTGGSISYAFRKWFACQRIPTDWYENKYAHAGNYFRKMVVGPFCLGCFAPCKASSVALSDGYGHVRCVKPDDKQAKGKKKFLLPAGLMRTYYNLSSVSPSEIGYGSTDDEHRVRLAETICTYSRFLSSQSGTKIDNMCIPSICNDQSNNPMCAKYLGTTFNGFKLDVNLSEYSVGKVWTLLFVICILVALQQVTRDNIDVEYSFASQHPSACFKSAIRQALLDFLKRNTYM